MSGCRVHDIERCTICLPEPERERGAKCWPMPERVCGPLNRYALVTRGDEARMVHTEGVAYLVRDDKPWRWNDFDPDAEEWSLADLVLIAREEAEAMDLADWVRVHNARLESNFWQVWHWVVHS